MSYYTLVAGRPPEPQTTKQKRSLYRNVLRDAAAQFVNSDIEGLRVDLGIEAKPTSVYQSLLRMSREPEFQSILRVSIIGKREVWLVRR